MKLKSAIFYFDVQNLYRSAKNCYTDSAVTHPNFDPVKLADWVCSKQHLKIEKIKFYTGVPPKDRDSMWHYFWTKKIASLNKNPLIETFTRATKQRPHKYRNSLGKQKTILVEVEKGVDVRIAIDIVRDAIDKKSESIVIFSRDQDLSEATTEAKKIAKNQKRQLDMYSVFPKPSNMHRSKGINGTAWIRLKEKDYKKCIDPKDYREYKYKK